MDKELEKLADLEFEYKITKLYYSDDKEKMILAKGKYIRQLNKVKKMQEKEESKNNEQR